MTRHAPTNTTRLRPRRRGFTIVELLVAVSLLALMLFLIDNLFNSTTRAVSDGVRQSAVLANARAVQSRLTIDASAMLGPNAQNPAPEGGGYIVIINKRIQAQVLRRDGSESLETFRVDQLAFMASTTAATSNIREFRSGAPRNANQFGSDFTSPYALIRYGHARRVNRDGTDLSPLVELGFDRRSGLDRLANDWVLARQAVLFAPTDSAGQPLTAADWFTDTPRISDPINSPANPIDQAWRGYSDVALLPPAGPLTSANPGFVDAYLDPANVAPAVINDNYLLTTFAAARLRINPVPTSPTAAAGDYNASPEYAAWKVGQLHGIFAPNCSEIIIQFAADVDGDREIDRVNDQGTLNPADDDNTGTEANGDPIYWYDMDTIADMLALNNDWDGATSTEFNAPYFDISGLTAHGDVAFIFKYNDDGTLDANASTGGTSVNSKWPYMIRIRYRLHDAPGRLESNASFRRADGFSNDDDNGDGSVDGADTPDEADEAIVSGRYFEQIIRVPRP